MFRLTLKNLVANRVRFALTTFGVILAVSFVVSAFVLGDGLRSTFGDLSEEITAGVDLEVRPTDEFGEPESLSADLVPIIASIDGVADAQPVFEAPESGVRPLRATGEGISTTGPPQLAFNWADNLELSPFTLVEGHAPGQDEFVMDLDAAAKYDFVVGEAYDVITPTGRHQLTLSGTSSFGADNSTLGAVLMQMNTDQAAELFGLSGASSIGIQLSDGADSSAVQAAIVASTPDAEVVNNATVTDETKAEFNSEIDIIGNILLGFAGVSLFVSIFIIYNTFAIVLGQRTQELALLRTIGATPQQVRRSVLGEAFIVGTVASLGGIAGGVAVAKGLAALFGALGASLPDMPTIIAPRTIIAAVVIGLGVTMLAAIGPAQKASTVPAIAALRGGIDAGAVGSRTRIISGTTLFVSGCAVGAFGLAGSGGTAVTIALLAAGAVSVFLGVTLLSPMAVGAVTRTLGWPLRKTAGVAGHLAQQNAARNPRRTATTAAALMIGLALVSMALVVGQSVKTSLAETLEQSVTADYIVNDQTEDFRFPTSLADDIARNESFSAVTGFRYTEARVDGTVDDVVAADFTQVEALLNIDVRQGGYDTAASDPMLVASDTAETLGLGIGDTLMTEFSNGSTVEATITGIYHDQSIIDVDYFYDIATFEDAGVNEGDTWLAFSAADSADPASVAAAVDTLSGAYPQSNVDTTVEFRERIEGFVDQALAIVNVMVALAVIIALIGIANTLALSVFERTRELGLVRAVGMTRRQLRRMVRFEASLVATFGAILGVAVGILFGWGVVTALPDSFASAVSIPVGRIIILVVVAGVAGVVAAWLPARRASRLNVLDAIAH